MKQKFGFKTTQKAGDELRKIEAKEYYNYKVIPFDQIRPSEYNTYKMETIADIKESIKKFGLFDNLLLGQLDPDEEYSYEIIGGEQRYWAIKELLEEGDDRFKVGIPSNIFSRDTPKIIKKIIMEESNIKRRNLTPSDMASHISNLEEYYKEAYEQKLLSGQKNLTKLISKETGIGERQVQRYKAINNNLIPEIKELFDSKQIAIEKAAHFSTMDEDTQRLIFSLLESNKKVTQEELDYIKEQQIKAKENEKELKKKIETLQKEFQLKEEQMLEMEMSKDATDPDSNEPKMKELMEEKENLEKLVFSLKSELKETTSSRKKKEIDPKEIEKIRTELELKRLMEEIEESLYVLMKKSESYQKKYGNEEKAEAFWIKLKNIVSKELG